MTTRMLVSCDGTRPWGSVERCRAFLPARTPYMAEARALAARAGWTRTPEGGDHCPDCTRDAAASGSSS